jgi:hypothetical protein
MLSISTVRTPPHDHVGSSAILMIQKKHCLFVDRERGEKFAKTAKNFLKATHFRFIKIAEDPACYETISSYYPACLHKCLGLGLGWLFCARQ